MIDIHYPVSRCHFCDHIMLYDRHDNIEIAYCNNQHSCMSFKYTKTCECKKINDMVVMQQKIQVESFELCYQDNIYQFAFKASDSRLVINNINTVYNIFSIDPNIILDKTASVNLISKVCKIMLLL